MRARARHVWSTATLVVLATVGVLAGCSPGTPEPDASATAQVPADAPYRDASLPVPARVDDLIARMTLAEKIGQLTLIERDALALGDVRTGRVGNVLTAGGGGPRDETPAGWADMVDTVQQMAASSRLGIPVLYAVDAVHGLGHLPGATVFPHHIGLGATRDAALVEEVGRAVAAEISAVGIDVTYAPTIAVARDDRWGRTYESFGEDPQLVAELGAAEIAGLQGDDLADPESVIATAKHFLGDGGTTGGVDRGDVAATEDQVRELFLPPYRAAVDAGVGSVMVSFSSIEGEPMHASTHWVSDVLRDELGFTGFVVSDYAALDLIDGADGLSADEVATGINAGIDVVMVPTDADLFAGLLTGLVESGEVSTARLDEAVRAVLTVKFEAGLFESAGADPARFDEVGSDEHRALARRAAAESVVVLSDERGMLPLAPGARVLVAGRSADDVGVQCGGWTLEWQGRAGNQMPGTTIREGASAIADVTYSADGSAVDGSYDAAIVVVGEQPYAEYEGDVGDGDLRLTAADHDLVARVAASGVPTVLVLLSGRPLDLTPELDLVDATVAAWLPGTEGDGVTDVLFGAVGATGTLPVSWPSSVAQEPINAGDGQVPAFPFGWGITYPAR